MTHQDRQSYAVRSGTPTYKHLDDIPERIKKFLGGTHRHSTLSSAVYRERIDDHDHVKLSSWSAPGRTKPGFQEAIKQPYTVAKKGQSFGPAWTNHWFRVTLDIPPDWKNHERIQFEFDCSGEAMVFTTSGEIKHGLTGGYGRDRRVEFILPASDVERGHAEYYIEFSCNQMFGQALLTNPDPNNVGQDILDTAGDDQRSYTLYTADLVSVNLAAQRLYMDFVSLEQLASSLPAASTLGHRARWTANAIVNAFRADDVDSFERCRLLAAEILGPTWESKLEEREKAGFANGTVWALGHCHIDTAWLWPIEVTQQKSARSWSTQCDLMDRYPEHRFAATQAQQYKWVEQLYPELFARIAEKVKSGMFQPVGGTWVEMDVNMPSGESLCRQFLYGQRYFESRFGKRSHTCLLPDTFGYCAQLPQIIRLADAQDFFTIKLSWNTINKFPHSTFNWAALDGTQVLAHLSPTDSYSSQCDIEEICQAASAHKNVEVTPSSVFLFGNGDGGGGPTPAMLEKLRRVRAINQHPDSPGVIPKLQMGGDFGSFFDSVRAETNNGLDLPVWRGEMYFECHRGTYTTHAAIKKGNRKSEHLIRQVEYAATLASLLSTSYEYPFESLDEAWEDILLCQFHDVLPGSGIAMIYIDARRRYDRIAASLSGLLASAFDHILSCKTTPHAEETGTFVAFNTIPGQQRCEVVNTLGLSGSARGSTPAYALLECGAHELLAARCESLGTTPPVTARAIDKSHFVLENSTIRVAVKDGRITSFFDIETARELIPAGQSAGLVMMEDVPNNYDAWDIDSFHLEKRQQLEFKNVRIVSSSPLRVTLATTVIVKGSRIDIDISLDATPASTRPDSRAMLRFDARADWHSSHVILKFEMPTTLLSEEATYDAAFGYVKRPTHRNTSHEAAKFEVCGHAFADLSEYGYGVAIVNDCKYGYAVCGSHMTLSLLRAPKSPDPDADMGTHEFSWAVYPHLGTYTESDVAQVAAAFNNPLKAHIELSPRANILVPFSIVGAPNVVIDTVKRGETDRAAVGGVKSVIVRMYEKFGGRALASLRVLGFAIERAETVNVLEDAGGELPCERTSTSGGETTVKLEFRGFEIKTVRLTIQRHDD